jgi:hypothetical protein
MPFAGQLTRRALVRSLTAGGALGGLWAAGLRATGIPDVPTLSVAGTGASQVALLDTTGSRALVLLGTTPQELLDQVPAMLTILRQRIDLLIGDESNVDAIADHARDRWNVAHELVIPTILGGRRDPTSPRRTVVRGDLGIELDQGITASLTIAPRDEWKMASASEAAATRWALAVRRDGSEVVMGPAAEAVLLATAPRPSLVVSPGDDARLIAQKIRPGAIALNASAIDEARNALGEVATVRIFRDDVARFELNRDGVRLPAWAQTAYSSDSERS